MMRRAARPGWPGQARAADRPQAFSRASMVIFAFRTLDTGQPVSALRAASSKAWALAPG